MLERGPPLFAHAIHRRQCATSACQQQDHTRAHERQHHPAQPSAAQPFAQHHTRPIAACDLVILRKHDRSLAPFRQILKPAHERQRRAHPATAQLIGPQQIRIRHRHHSSATQRERDDAWLRRGLRFGHRILDLPSQSTTVRRSATRARRDAVGNGNRVLFDVCVLAVLVVDSYFAVQQRARILREGYVTRQTALVGQRRVERQHAWAIAQRREGIILGWAGAEWCGGDIARLSDAQSEGRRQPERVVIG